MRWGRWPLPDRCPLSVPLPCRPSWASCSVTASPLPVSPAWSGVTVLLAAVVLHERPDRTQLVGLGLCAVAVTAIVAS